MSEDMGKVRRTRDSWRTEWRYGGHGEDLEERGSQEDRGDHEDIGRSGGQTRDTILWDGQEERREVRIKEGLEEKGRRGCLEARGCGLLCLLSLCLASVSSLCIGKFPPHFLPCVLPRHLRQFTSGPQESFRIAVPIFCTSIHKHSYDREPHFKGQWIHHSVYYG